MGKWVGVCAIDPGGTSGYAQGVVPVTGSLAWRIKRMQLRKCVEVPSKGRGFNGMSDELVAAFDLFRLYNDFDVELQAKNLGPPVLVIEDFNLRGQVGSTERHGISPVRVTSALEAMIALTAGAPAAQVWQAAGDGGYVDYESIGMDAWLRMPWFIQPSIAKQVATNDRLKNWGLWEVGSDHKRDAWRHWVTWVRAQQRVAVYPDLARQGSKEKRFNARGNYGVATDGQT